MDTDLVLATPVRFRRFVRRSLLTAAIAAVMLGTHSVSSPPQESPAAPQRAPFGAIEGALEIDRSGAATYRIEIDVPPGTAGMQPEISLIYNGLVPNGIAGMGFSLTGLPAITRTGATIVQDDFKGGVAYDARDRFSLDGFRLVNIEGEYGRPGTVYHTEKESWTRIVPNGTCGSGPCSFTATNRDGTVVELGTTADSRILRTGAPDVRVWAVSRITDTNGNALAVFWTTADGEMYADKILYTANAAAHPNLQPQRAVVFGYEPRRDVSLKYLGGAIVKTARRLQTITTCVSSSAAITDCSGTSTASLYTLDYEYAPSTGRSRLTSVTACGGDGAERECLEPTRFRWQDEPKTFTPATATLPGPLYAIINRQPWVTALLEDINGDGVADYCRATRFAESGANDLRIYHGRTDGSFVDSGISLPGPVYVSTRTTTVRNGVLQDLNGDGLPDYSVATVNENSGEKDLTVWVNTGSGFVHKPDFVLPDRLFWIVGQQSYTTGLLQDLDGDGIPEYSRATRLTASGEQFLDIYRGTGNGFAATGKRLPGPVFAVGGKGSDNIAVLQDMNGDGIPDYSPAMRNSNTDTVDLSVRLGRTPEFDFVEAPFQLPDALYWTVGQDVFTTGTLQDLNGDQIADYSRATLLENTDEKLYAVSLGTGHGFVSAGWSLPGPLYVIGRNGSRPEGVLLDRDGDGHADYSRATEWVNDGTRDLRIWRGTETGFIDAEFSLPDAIFTVGEFGSYTNGVMQDVNGDNLADYVEARCTQDAGGSLQDCRKRIQHISGPSPDYVTRITSGLGRVTSLTWSPLTNTAAYSRGGTGPPESVNIQWPMYVVSSYEIETAASPGDPAYARYTHRFRYEGGRVDRLGRGFLGFAKIAESDLQTGITTTTTYEQQFPLDAAIRGQSVTRTSDGAPLGETANTHSSSNPFPGVYMARLDEQRLVRRASSGSYTTSIAYWYDKYGNTVLTRERANGDSAAGELYTCNAYLNSSSPHRIGFLL
ncbi:MAG TPA: toxin TcdB middle/N-terminal domain-containing protein, partial [Thermoanaerobaculia bacterium]|nr:toxin TcdB middle/N-terminal domain-containing protein [Thermoanaerobaculia bacterium]